MRRYADSSKKFFLRCLEELYKHRAEKAEQSKQGAGRGYYLPWPTWFAAPDVVSQAAGSTNSEIRTPEGQSTKSEIGNPNGAEDEGTSTKSDIRNPKEDENAVDAAIAEAQGANLNECDDAGKFAVAAVEKTVKERLTRVVSERPGPERSHGINVPGGSKKERRKRRREARMMARELAVSRAPLLFG
jgi:hypothetical protein